MITLIRTDSENPDFIDLVVHLDAYLSEKDGDEHAFYNQFNKIDKITHVIVAYHADKPVGCGAIKEYDLESIEVKRMFTSPNTRGLGVATSVLKGLEIWANELGYQKCVLETGKRQVEAIALYEKCNYNRIPNYGQYIGIENSVCFEKSLSNPKINGN